MRNDAGINGDAQRIEQIAWMLFLKVYDEKENDWEFNEDNYTSFIPENCRWRNWAHDEGDGEALTADRLLDFVDNTLFPTLKNLEVTPETPMRSAIVRATFEDANQYMKDGVLLRQVINVIDGLDLSSYEESHAFGEIYETILKEMQSAGSAGEFYTPRALTDFMAEIIRPQVGEQMADFACGTGGFLTSWLKMLDREVHTAEDREAYAQSIYGIEKKQFPYMLCVTNMLLHDIDSPTGVSRQLAHQGCAQLYRRRPVRCHPDESPLWRQREERREAPLPIRPLFERDGRPLHGGHHVSSGTERTCCRHPARRLPLWHRRRQAGHQGETPARVQPPHHHPSAGQHLLALHLHRHQHPLLQQRGGRGSRRGLQHRPRRGSTASTCPRATSTSRRPSP